MAMITKNEFSIITTLSNIFYCFAMVIIKQYLWIESRSFINNLFNYKKDSSEKQFNTVIDSQDRLCQMHIKGGNSCISVSSIGQKNA